MNPPGTGHRRRSLNTLGYEETCRPRSASYGLIEGLPYTPSYTHSYTSYGSSSQHGPATPCFVSPRMAFTTQFNYDSPIQVLTSRSPCVFKPMAVPQFSGSCSLKRLPHSCKILLTILLLSLAGSLFFLRNMSGTTSTLVSSTNCSAEGDCNLSHSHLSLKRFLGSVKTLQYHALKEELEDHIEEIPHTSNGIEGLEFYTNDESSGASWSRSIDNPADQLAGTDGTQAGDWGPVEVDSDYETSQWASGNPVSQTEIQGDSEERWMENPNTPNLHDSSEGLVVFESAPLTNEHASDLDIREKRSTQQEMETNIGSYGNQRNDGFSNSQPWLSEREVAARMTKYSDAVFREQHSYQREAPDNFDAMNFGRSNRPSPRHSAEIHGPRHSAEIHGPRHSAEIHGPRHSAEIHGPRHSAEIQVPRRSSEGFRMNRLPPGINPRKYRTEF